MASNLTLDGDIVMKNTIISTKMNADNRMNQLILVEYLNNLLGELLTKLNPNK